MITVTAGPRSGPLSDFEVRSPLQSVRQRAGHAQN